MSTHGQSQASANSAESDSKLPLWDGTHLTGLPWLRELEASEHLFDADIAYYLRTGTVVTSANFCSKDGSLPFGALLTTAPRGCPMTLQPYDPHRPRGCPLT